MFSCEICQIFQNTILMNICEELLPDLIFLYLLKTLTFFRIMLPKNYFSSKVLEPGAASKKSFFTKNMKVLLNHFLLRNVSLNLLNFFEIQVI